MITFVPKPNGVPAVKPDEESRFDRIRRIAADKHKKSDSDTAAPSKSEPKRPM